MASGAQSVNHLDERYDGETPDILDNAYVIVEYDNGARGLLDLCMFAEASKNEQEISVVGDEGKLEALVTESVLRVGRRADGLHAITEHTITDDSGQARRVCTTVRATSNTSTSPRRSAAGSARR